MTKILYLPKQVVNEAKLMHMILYIRKLDSKEVYKYISKMSSRT